MTSNEDRTAAIALSRRILALARQHDHAALLAIDSDPETGRLLGSSDEELAKAASVHLRGARAWRRKKEDANLRRLEEARTAIDGFDIARAKSLLLRIEDDYLTPESSSLRDGVLLDLEARSMESESLQASADQIIVEHLPRWKRWLRRRG
ncbi:MAG: hypothetical protein ACN4GK_12400 [Acidimicrobiia bacterium]